MGKKGREEKALNPVQKARKNAKKKELKKNKERRQVAKDNIIKNHVAKQIIEDLKKLDQEEDELIENNSPHNKQAFEEKREKLRSTLLDMINLYQKEGNSRHMELKKILDSYDVARNNDQKYRFTRKKEEERNYKIRKHALVSNLANIPFPSCQPVHPASTTENKISSNVDPTPAFDLAKLNLPNVPWIPSDLKPALPPPSIPHPDAPSLPPHLQSHAQSNMQLMNQPQNIHSTMQPNMQHINQPQPNMAYMPIQNMALPNAPFYPDNQYMTDVYQPDSNYYYNLNYDNTYYNQNYDNTNYNQYYNNTNYDQNINYSNNQHLNHQQPGYYETDEYYSMPVVNINNYSNNSNKRSSKKADVNRKVDVEQATISSDAVMKNLIKESTKFVPTNLLKKAKTTKTVTDENKVEFE